MDDSFSSDKEPPVCRSIGSQRYRSDCSVSIARQVGWDTVRCISVAPPYEYMASADDVKSEPRLVEGATYQDIDTQLFDMSLSPTPRGKGKRGR
jgi:hypothetical protein